jgi:alpha-L-fucosidase
MTQARRRYTTNDKSTDWIVTVGWSEEKLNTAHWFEASVEAVNEQTGEAYPFPGEISTYRIGEIEHTFKEYVKIDFDGDQEAALKHLQDSIYRRVYSYIERGH